MDERILDELSASQQLVTGMLRILADDPSARIGAWDLRDVAAHLAATERECYEPRIRAIAAGEHPQFSFFTHDGRDFSGSHIESALDDWSTARNRVIEFVSGLNDEELALVGHHEKYGAVTVGRYLEIALEHDRDHLQGLERLAGARSR